MKIILLTTENNILIKIFKDMFCDRKPICEITWNNLSSVRFTPRAIFVRFYIKYHLLGSFHMLPQKTAAYVDSDQTLVEQRSRNHVENFP